MKSFKPKHIHHRDTEDTENLIFSLAGDTAKEKPTCRYANIRSIGAAGREVFKNRHLPIFEKRDSVHSVPLW